MSSPRKDLVEKSTTLQKKGCIWLGRGSSVGVLGGARRLPTRVPAMPPQARLASRLARGFPSPVTRRTLSSRTAFARSLFSARIAGTASTGARGTATAAVATKSQPPLACVLSVPTMAGHTVAFTVYFGWRWERSLSTRVLTVTACTCCASARHLLVSVNSRRRGAEPLLHGEQQQRGHRVVDRCRPQVYAASMLSVSPRACGARYTARQQEQ